MTANNITINGGSINWQNVSKPSYTAADIGAISSTYTDQNGIWTGSINANSITTGKLDVDRITLKGLDVKNSGGNTTFAIDSNGNVTLGGSITWGDKPSYSYSELGGSKPPTNADKTIDELRYNSSIKGFYYNPSTNRLELHADDITAGTISGSKIDGGIISGVDINVSSDVYIGDKLHINPNNFGAGIRWGSSLNSPEIYIDPASKAMFIAASGGIYVNSKRIDISPRAVFG